jgi:class 3 adenylate cyclase
MEIKQETTTELSTDIMAVLFKDKTEENAGIKRNDKNSDISVSSTRDATLLNSSETNDASLLRAQDTIGLGVQPRRSSVVDQQVEVAGNGHSKNNFALRSIRRGTQDWIALVRPFVADLAFCSVVSRHFHQDRRPMFRPFTTPHAAVLFVDISGYSRIAAVLADRGAHALSTAVNSYLSRILQIVRSFGGDVVKFAGDAVLCLWWYDGQNNGAAPSKSRPGHTNVNNQTTAQEMTRYNILSAALCAVELQNRAGSHAVDGTDQEFRIHIGLCHGIVESEIFVAPNHNTYMQRMYHLVGGEALEKIGDLVDCAKAGQVCIGGGIHRCLQTFASEGTITVDCRLATNYQKDSDGDESDTEDEEPQLLIDLTVLKEETRDDLDNFVEERLIERMNRRTGAVAIAEDFIHPAVLDLLSHGGLSPTQIAQMRDLVVLFIAQTSHGSPATWLLEVHAVLDRNQCPLLQIVADDKGVHAIAAVNAVAAIPESRMVGLEICRQLVNQKIGVAVGMAAGVTFCGVTGSSSVACRWDITGEAAVRAARLMQYALKRNVPLALDESLCMGPTVPARMALLEKDVPIKGSQDPIPIYTLSDATEFAAMDLLESVHGEMHNLQVDSVKKHISGPHHRTAVIVTGPTLAGKKM